MHNGGRVEAAASHAKPQKLNALGNEQPNNAINGVAAIPANISTKLNNGQPSKGGMAK